MERLTDTIAAIATAQGRGGIGIVRVSGPEAVAIVRAVLRPARKELEPRRVYHGWVEDPRDGHRVDEVLAFVMRAPHSYTGEDVGELQGHGGSAALGAVLDAVLAAGARRAEPGEFTKRAFLNGRLDLCQAEAVADVVAAQSERALRQAQAQLGGALGREVQRLRGEALGLLAEVEAGLDFAEEDIAPASRLVLAKGALGVAQQAQDLCATYRAARAVREGLDVVLVGRTNVGKSSLLNALAGEERALVDPRPHTTRDCVEASLLWDGVPVVLVDTAGLGEGPGELEARGMSMGQRRAARADVVVLVCEAGRALLAEEQKVWESLPGTKVLVLSKADAVDEDAIRKHVPAWAPVAAVTSARTGRGLGDLRKAVLAAAGVGGWAGDAEEGAVVATERQRALLDEARTHLEAAAAQLEQGIPGEIVAISLQGAVRALGAVRGSDLSEEVLDVIFSRFCIGK